MKMYRISEENTKEIRKRMGNEKNVNAYKRLQAVALRGEGKTSEEIAKITGYHPDHVGRLCKEYLAKGLAGLLDDGRKGGNNRKLTKTEAAAFLQKYEEQAKSGQIITAKAIGKAYDETVGKEHKSLSSIYYFLRSHGWRKIMPKKQHPGKASAEAIEASKKLTMSSRK
jgi:transposase